VIRTFSSSLVAVHFLVAPVPRCDPGGESSASCSLFVLFGSIRVIRDPTLLLLL
jgi:hypothetical protein